MINAESKTLRDFSVTTKAQNGDTIKVYFGYDTSASHSGYYLDASINGQKRKSDSNTLRRVRALKIDILSRIIDAIGTDVTGVRDDFDQSAENIVLTGDVKLITQYFRITESDDLDMLNASIEQLKSAKTIANLNRITKKFINSQRIRLLELNRNLIQDIREFYQNGITISGNHILPVFEGLLRKTHNPLYYKRDMDYIRKARVRLFTKVLRKAYRPF